MFSSRITQLFDAHASTQPSLYVTAQPWITSNIHYQMQLQDEAKD